MSRQISRFLIIALLLAGTVLTYFVIQRGTGPAALLALVTKKAAPTVLGWPAQVTPLSGGGSSGLLDVPAGQAAQARFGDPFGLVLDRQGNIYVADAGENNRIRKITPDGVVTTFAGSHEGYADGLASAAAFHTPSALAIDDAGNIYVADTGNNAIRKITPQGMVSTLAGNGKPGYLDGAAAEAQFNGPIGVAVDKTGKVYVADTYNDKIRLITPDGQVSTIAGGARPGYQDGLAQDALFDTPCALVINAKGELFIADTRNNAIRKISGAGEVTTVTRSLPDDPDALMKRPIGLALTHDGFLYVGEMSNGRILQISPGNELRGLTGIDIDIASGDDISLRLQRPVGIAIDKAGSLIVTDATNFAVRKIMPKASNPPAISVATPVATPVATLMPPVHENSAAATPATANFPWPLKPQNQPREVVGTIGEVRGNYEGESRDHFHRGLDMQAAMGAAVVAVASEKISSPLPAWGINGLNEGMRIATMSYIHMRVGRAADDTPLDPARFTLINDEQDNQGKQNKLAQVRVKRGTRFQVGDTLGTVNRMYHVHLNYNPAGQVVNPLSLSFKGFKDEVIPTIEDIMIVDQSGQALSKKKHDKRLAIARSLGAVSIIVDAYDQADGNAKRRRLGLYQVGYQILHPNGTPLAGYEQPRINLEFNRLPADEEAVKIAYAEQSGITVHGNASTRFLYNVTNVVRDGHAKTGFWQLHEVPAGDYLIRILAADYAGNQASSGRDLAIRVE
ncbi:MAG: gluconolaconase [Undibacterium sp.]|nr:gluconolaconase [Undibacterium sp.]